MLSILMAGVVALAPEALEQVLSNTLAVAAYERRVARMPRYQDLGGGSRHACSISRAATDATYELKAIRQRGAVFVADEQLGGPDTFTLSADHLQIVDQHVLNMERNAAFYAGLCR